MKKAVEGAFALWLVFVTVRYAETVLKSVASPLNPRRDTGWLVLWLIGVTLIVVFCYLWQRAAQILVVLAIAAAIAIAVLSSVFHVMLLSLWFVLVVYAWGTWLLRLTHADPEDLIQSIAVAVPLGFVVPATAGFLLASVHLLNVTSVWLVVLALTAFQFRTILSLPQCAVEIGTIPFDTAFPILLTIPVVILNLIWAVAPEIQYDANNYHLALPRTYLESGGFVNMPYVFQSYYSHFAEMMFLFPMALHGQTAAKLLTFILSLVAGCCVLSLGREAFGAKVGCWAAAYFYTTPIVSWLAGTAYTDNISAMFLGATLLAFVRWYKTPSSNGWIPVIGALAGMTVASKMNAAFGLPVVIAIVCWKARHASIWRVAIFIALIIGVALPWFALTYHWTANPVFPVLNGLFKSPLWPQNNTLLNSNAFGIGTSIGSMVRLPFRLVFNTDRFGEALPRGSAGLALLIAFPFSVVLLAQGRRTAALLGSFVVFWLGWSYSFQYLRYFVSIMPAVCVLASATVLSLNTSRGSSTVCRICLAVGLIMQFPSMPLQFWNIPERFPLRVAFGLETREHFLDRALLGYSGVTHLNRELKPGDRVIGVGVEQTRLYLNAPLETLAGSTLGSKLHRAAAMPADQLQKTLLADGFKYIFVTRTALQDSPEQYPYLRSDFLSRFATLEFMDSSTLVYRLNA